MHGAPTDNNATLFTDGYNSVLNPLEKSGKVKLLQNTAGTWNPTSPSPDALDEFKAAYTNLVSKSTPPNSAVIPNDENGAPIITWLQSQGVKPHTFPMTGQDATLTGLDNILSGYQCGTVYKPIYKEASAAVALALYLRAGKTAPKSLLNSTTTDPSSKKQVPSVLETPEWVTASTMKSTVVADKFVPVTGSGSSAQAATRLTARSTGSSSSTDPLIGGRIPFAGLFGARRAGLPIEGPFTIRQVTRRDEHN